jgi:hypothetical protein
MGGAHGAGADEVRSAGAPLQAEEAAEHSASAARGVGESGWAGPARSDRQVPGEDDGRGGVGVDGGGGGSAGRAAQQEEHGRLGSGSQQAASAGLLQADEVAVLSVAEEEEDWM